jgi:hypothetical protein
MRCRIPVPGTPLRSTGLNQLGYPAASGSALWSLFQRFDYLAIAFSLSSLAFLTAGLSCILWYQAQLVGYFDSHS